MLPVRFSFVVHSSLNFCLVSAFLMLSYSMKLFSLLLPLLVCVHWLKVNMYAGKRLLSLIFCCWFSSCLLLFLYSCRCSFTWANTRSCVWPCAWYVECWKTHARKVRRNVNILQITLYGLNSGTGKQLLGLTAIFVVHGSISTREEGKKKKKNSASMLQLNANRI